MADGQWRDICALPCERCGGTGRYSAQPEVPNLHVATGTGTCSACKGTGHRQPSDQEIGDWLAEKVKGWGVDGGYLWQRDGEGWASIMHTRDWHPLADANHALMLVASTTWSVRISVGNHMAREQPQPMVEIWSRLGHGPAKGKAPTFCEALCLAAARAWKQREGE